MTDYRPAVRSCPEGSALRLRVVPRSPRARLDGLHGDAVKLRVRAPPAGGKANAEVVALVASLLALPARDVEIAAGERSRDKVVHVHGLSPGEVTARLANPSRGHPTRGG